MNCQEFKTWIIEREFDDGSTTGNARIHMSVCDHCQKLYSVDAIVEEQISRSLAEVDPPATLLSRIETDIRSAGKNTVAHRSKWKIIGPPLAMAALILIFFVNPFSGQIRNIEHFGALALEHHNIEEDMTMKFRTGEISDVSGWFAKQLGFNVVIPDFATQGLTFIGGRKCSLGKKQGAHLSYSKNGKRCSLFITDNSGLALGMEPKKIYPVDNNNHVIKVWQDDSLIYASIE